jgi:hypothetical protein
MRLSSIIAIITLGLVGCSSTPSHNPTVYPFNINEEAVAEVDVKTVVIAHVNLGLRSRSYLEKESKRIDADVDRYLREHGYKVLPQREFKQHWSTAERAFGDPVDPTTGKINMKTFAQIMTSVRDQMKDSGLDAFIFTDLQEQQQSFSNGLKHLARWDGVNRKPSLQGPGNGVSGDFDWYKQASVASIQISIYDMELRHLFTSRGGLDATEAIDTRSSSGRFVRRRNILENEDHVGEGIALALHPFIVMEDWPGNP